MILIVVIMTYISYGFLIMFTFFLFTIQKILELNPVYEKFILLISKAL